MKTIGKKSRFKIHLINSMGNATECIYYQKEIECDNAIFELSDEQLYKAYNEDHLYSWHSKLA